MSYDPASISAHYDQYGSREWERLVAAPADEVSLYIHTHYLRQHIPEGARVLEIGAGAGRFTQVLAQIGARVVVADISAGQIALNRQFAEQYGFAGAVEDWQVADICELSRFPEDSFDRVVAYGGPFSYVLDRRDQALAECLRVLQPGGLILGSVMCLRGTMQRHLIGVLDRPPEVNRRVVSTGDLKPETDPQRKGHFMHMFRSDELRGWLESRGLRVLALSASGALSNGHRGELDPIRQDPQKWSELLQMDLTASAEPGCLDMGTHLIFVVQKG